eukprot:3902407-Rhodomonas_salina.1
MERQRRRRACQQCKCVENGGGWYQDSDGVDVDFASDGDGALLREDEAGGRHRKHLGGRQRVHVPAAKKSETEAADAEQWQRRC